ncbi:hypothetical protein Pmani_015806 [Petrolisthes manimaculis]|uniref:Uncharacterized protein n=1 Tax=Petrolisthes manimaculis TaxID=1843537 RepID=A0AAE1PT22_9EUCA|nr:hypothetical protein Pmani_015806 [Petrolisthes manimaculis]
MHNYPSSHLITIPSHIVSLPSSYLLYPSIHLRVPFACICTSFHAVPLTKASLTSLLLLLCQLTIRGEAEEVRGLGDKEGDGERMECHLDMRCIGAQ